MRRLCRTLAFAAVTLVFVAACSSTDDRSDSSSLVSRFLGEPEARAIASMKPAPGSRVGGDVRFLQYGNSVVVRVSLFGLPPNRTFGLHVHDKGDCAAPGGHFNPQGKPHGRYDAAERHAGDLPNVRADGEGNAHYAWDTEALSLRDGPNNVLARSVVLTGDADDYRTQPDGKAGAPLACGLVRRQ